MEAYTNLEQSQMLAKFLPIENIKTIGNYAEKENKKYRVKDKKNKIIHK